MVTLFVHLLEEFPSNLFYLISYYHEVRKLILQERTCEEEMMESDEKIKNIGFETWVMTVTLNTKKR